jgi:hypothetical protein
LATGSWSREERRLISRSLTALGQQELAPAFEATFTVPLVESAAAVSSHWDPSMPSRNAVEAALLRGDATGLEAALPAVSPDRAQVYRLLGAPQPAAELFHVLEPLVSRGDFDSAFRGEMEFYLGCLALEAGDSATAVRWFSASQAADAASPRRSLIDFYRAQLAGR